MDSGTGSYQRRARVILGTACLSVAMSYARGGVGPAGYDALGGFITGNEVGCDIIIGWCEPLRTHARTMTGQGRTDVGFLLLSDIIRGGSSQ